MIETYFLREGSADKQYSISMNKAGDGYAVVCYNGRRGGPQQTQNKTAHPVTKAEAEELCAKIRKEKLAKGYKPGIHVYSGDDETPPPAAAAWIPAERQRAADVRAVESYRPMLLNPLGPKEAEALLSDPDWIMQQKVDGVRAIVEIFPAEKLVSAWSRTGKPVALTAQITRALLAAFETHMILDTESLGDALVIFDVLLNASGDLRHESNEFRAGLLDCMEASFDNPCLVFIQTARTADEKRAALELLRTGGAEGVVFKRRAAHYTAGRPSSGGPALKWKFVAGACVRVAKVNKQRSVDMAMADGTTVGSVTIPVNKKVPQVGQLIAVEYLYAHRGGSLAQPVYKGVREDADSADTTDSLQYKGEER